MAERLRVLLVTEAAGGGVGRHVLDLADGLIESGHRTTLAYSPARAEPGFAEQVSALPGLSAVTVPMRRAPGPWDLGAALELRRVCRQSGPFDVIHGHSSKAGALVRLSCRTNGTAIAYTPHALYTLNPNLGPLARFVFGAAERALNRSGDAVICVSDDEYRHAIELGIRASTLHMVANGIATLPAVDHAANRARLGLAQEDCCVGFVGRISEQKAVDRLVTEFSQVAANRPHLRLVVVGDGPDRASIESLSNTLGLGDRALFTGAIDGAEAMAAFDVFVLPSRYEGFPYVLLEAAARGLPIVTTEVGGASTVVQPEVNGFIVPGAQSGLLGQALCALHDDADMRRSMGRQSIRIARQFTSTRMVDETIAVYRQALGQCALPPAAQPVRTNSCR